MARNTIEARPVPPWAAGLVARLSRDRPAVVTREDIAAYLIELGEERPLKPTMQALQRLGWLSTLHIKGVWAFVPAGESRLTDPYLDLRAWRVRENDTAFALAGEAAAWHLGYVTRRFDGPPAIWIPPKTRVPHGLRSHISLVRIGWTIADLRELGPSIRLLRKKGLDLTAWAGGLPALGPDALLVQLGSRPGSFRTWADLIARLDALAADCDLERISKLLKGQSSSAWQRTAYLLDRGGQREVGLALLDRLSNKRMPAVLFGNGPMASWSKDFRVNDRLIAPLQQSMGKA